MLTRKVLTSAGCVCDINGRRTEKIKRYRRAILLYCWPENGWQIAGTPTFAYNHEGEDGNRFTFPLGTGVVKVTSFGKLPVKLALQYWYYVASPDNFGPQHLVRFQIAPVVPLPW
jgi:hypothetical protein